MPPLKSLIPGLALSLLLAFASIWAAELAIMREFGFSALTIAIAGGMIIGNTVYPLFAAPCHEGINFSKAKLLRLGIILFGFRLTFQDIAGVGLAGILIDALVLTSTFFLAWYLGRKVFGLDEESTILIGAGSAICGAAAVLATEPVLRAKADKVAVAVATVVVFGTLAMFVYPAAWHALVKAGYLANNEFAYGVFSGATIHEVAQVVAAGKAVSEDAATSAVITKMIRVMMLAPFLLILSSWLAKRHRGSGPGRGKVQIPWFAVLFLVVAGFNSLDLLSHPLVTWIVSFDNLMLAAAMAALGLTTHISAIRQAGVKPLALAALLFAWLIVGGALISSALLAWL
ncbi:YeiH family putative sulfate export transporter [Aquitalea sp. S1-19]|nr:YeiH family putative sulfate export transporter [Aquitalea sp. S1-19]